MLKDAKIRGLVFAGLQPIKPENRNLERQRQVLKFALSWRMTVSETSQRQFRARTCR
jgi:hypothetical protein